MSRDRTRAVALAALALAYLLAGREYPLDSLAAPGPGVFPLATGVALLLLAACQAGVDVARRRRGEVGGRRPRGPGRRREPALMAALLTAFAAAVPVLGFLASSAALVVLACRLMGVTSWLTAVGLAAGVTAAVHAVFVLWLGVPLPRGLLG